MSEDPQPRAAAWYEHEHKTVCVQFDDEYVAYRLEPCEAIDLLADLHQSLLHASGHYGADEEETGS